MDATDPTDAHVPAPQGTIAGFWRRTTAAFVDGLVLFMFGYLVGIAWFDRFVALGNYGRIAGLAVFLSYFGLQNSRIGHGQTLGKRLMRVRVVGSDGQQVGVRRSLTRAAVSYVPYSLIGIVESDDSFTLPSVAAVVLLAGVMCCDSYLYAFNRVTRRSLHDLLAGTCVVNCVSGPTPVASRFTPVWRGHVFACALILAALVANAFFAMRAANEASNVAFAKVREQVLREAAVTRLQARAFNLHISGQPSTRGLRIVVTVSSKEVVPERLAKRVASIMLDGLPPDQNYDWLTVTVTYGYDIGIATGSRRWELTRPPRIWRDMARSG